MMDSKAAITENLDTILAARAQKAAAQGARAQSLEQMWKEGQDKLARIYSKFSSLEEEQQDKICGEAAGLLRNLQEKADACGAAFQRAITELQDLENRFSRSTVNLVIVGAIGAGKSKFLQNASGLLDDCIPSYTGSSCTGVTSIIENSDGDVEAVFTFKTRQEALEDMQREVRSLARRLRVEEKVLVEMHDFADGVENLRNLAEIVNQPGQRIIGARDGVERPVVKQDKDDLKYLLSLYDKDGHLREWERYLSGACMPDDDLEPQGKPGQYVLKNRAKIEEYVSKHDKGDGQDHYQFYYKYAAVKKAVIRTRFPNQIDAHIRLIDTVGIGDTAADTEERIADAVRNDADGVIFLLSAGGQRPDNFMAQDRNLIEKFQDIYNSYSSKEVDEDGKPRSKKRTKYWMAFLVNDRYIAGTSPNNGQCYLNQSILPNFSGKNDIFGEEGIVYSKALDVSQPEQVEQMLSEFLQQISDHLKEIDAGIETSTNQACAQAEAQYQALLNKMRNIRINRNCNSRLVYIADITMTRIDNLRKALVQLASKILEEKTSGNQSASFLQECLKDVRTLEEDGILEDLCFGAYPDGVSLQRVIDHCDSYYCSKSIEERFLDTRLAVFHALGGIIREIGSRTLQPQEKAEKAFKKQIAEIFAEKLELDCQKLGDSPAEPLDIEDPQFFKKACERLISGLPYTEEIQKAFLSLDQFRLDKSNGITKALFCCLAPKHFGDDPYEESEFPLPDEGPYEERLLKELKHKLRAFIKDVDELTMSEKYLVDENDQMYYELVNFIQVLDPIYNGRWQNVFDSMDQRNLLQDDTDRRSRLAVAASIAEELDSLLRTL